MLQNCTSQLLGDSEEDSGGVDEQCHLVVEGEGPHKFAIKHLDDIVLAAVQAEVAEADLDSNRPPTPTIVHHSDGKVAGWGDGATPKLHFAGLKFFKQPSQSHTLPHSRSVQEFGYDKMTENDRNTATPELIDAGLKILDSHVKVTHHTADLSKNLAITKQVKMIKTRTTTTTMSQLQSIVGSIAGNQTHIIHLPA